MTAELYNIKILRLCAWMGPAFVAVFVIGALFLAGFFPPPSAANTAVETSAYYVGHLGGVRLGCIVMLFASGLYAPWGLTIALYTRIAEAGRPILFYLQIASVAITAVDILLIGVFWSIGAFRAGEVSPEITQTWNDAGWLSLLLTVPPFTVWCFAIAASIFGDTSAQPRFPRWVAYLNIWAGLLFLPADVVLFFKTGPFSQNGILAFWMPVIVFFFWIIWMSFLVLRAIRADEVELNAGTAITP